MLSPPIIVIVRGDLFPIAGHLSILLKYTQLNNLGVFVITLIKGMHNHIIPGRLFI